MLERVEAGGGMGDGSARCWSVSALLQCADSMLTQHLGTVRVSAEVAGFVRASSGHCYFSLKDMHGQLRCALFRRAAAGLAWLPQDGQRVVATGRVAVYGARGELQLIVETMQQEGEGDHFAQFLQLKARLEQEGLFGQDRKRPLRRVPWAVAVVTSEDAAALADVLRAMSRRAPHVRVLLFPCAVQGAGAPASICQALRGAAQWRCPHSERGVDAVMLVRGGGAWEDLHAYNDEGVARAIAACAVPVVCGVGHESDFTIADMVADVRAATPTAAAELCAAEQTAEVELVQSMGCRLEMAATRRVDRDSRELDECGLRLARTADRMGAMRVQMDVLARRMAYSRSQGSLRSGSECAALWARLQTAVRHGVERQVWHLGGLGDRLRTVSPTQTLARGFAYLRRDSQLVLSASSLSPNERVDAILADGVVEMNVVCVKSGAFLE